MANAAPDYKRRDYHSLNQEIRAVTAADRDLLRSWFRVRVVVSAIFLVGIAALAALAAAYLLHALHQPRKDSITLAILVAVCIVLAGILGLLLWGLASASRSITAQRKTVYKGYVTAKSDPNARSVGPRTRIESHFVFLDERPFSIPEAWLRQLAVGEKIEIECFEKNLVADILRQHDGKTISLRQSNSPGKPAHGAGFALLKMIMDFLSF